MGAIPARHVLQVFMGWAHEDVIAKCKRTGCDAALLKALDGATWMSHWDGWGFESADHIADTRLRFNAAGLKLGVWTNPRGPVTGVPQAVQAELHGEAIDAADFGYLDVEDGPEFWGSGNGDANAAAFIAAVRRLTSKPIVFQPDPRPWHMTAENAAGWLGGGRIQALAGQHYWSDFQRSAGAVLAEAIAELLQYDLPGYPTIPGNADNLTDLALAGKILGRSPAVLGLTYWQIDTFSDAEIMAARLAFEEAKGGVGAMWLSTEEQLALKQRLQNVINIANQAKAAPPPDLADEMDKIVAEAMAANDVAHLPDFSDLMG